VIVTVAMVLICIIHIKLSHAVNVYYQIAHHNCHIAYLSCSVPCNVTFPQTGN